MQTRHRLQAAPARSQAGADGASHPSPRDDERLLVHAVAAIVTGEPGMEPAYCAVRDLSQHGARLELDRCGGGAAPGQAASRHRPPHLLP